MTCKHENPLQILSRHELRCRHCAATSANNGTTWTSARQDDFKPTPIIPVFGGADPVTLAAREEQRRALMEHQGDGNWMP